VCLGLTIARSSTGSFGNCAPARPWTDIPERYGPSTTCYNRLVRWRKIGVWDRIFEAVSRAYDGDLQMVDSSSIRVHQHAANVKKGARRLPPLRTSLQPHAWGVREAG
jgi:transposase